MTEGEWNETDLDRNIRKVSDMYGWARFHPWVSVNSPAGFPDLTLTRDGDLIFAELKSPGSGPRRISGAGSMISMRSRRSVRMWRYTCYTPRTSRCSWND